MIVREKVIFFKVSFYRVACGIYSYVVFYGERRQYASHDIFG